MIVVQRMKIPGPQCIPEDPELSFCKNRIFCKQLTSFPVNESTLLFVIRAADEQLRQVSETETRSRGDPRKPAFSNDQGPHVHLKMMRLLFLCLLLLRAAVSEEHEGSAFDDTDDEDIAFKINRITVSTVANEAKGEQDDSNKLTVIIIVVAATVLALSVAAIVITLLVRRRMHSQQQGIYSVPTEQDKKGDI
ncbi:hypothetical protein Q5P01_011082 [Channa striata]|uniref:Uncharacterized protein n=1 Tax=Channa striata TaxID=64152 RepID=A0AA88ST34_CHASR|nr:hypothetical protein Q5P01_011082 [Channa striata]